jgi:hypothetical protein
MKAAATIAIELARKARPSASVGSASPPVDLYSLPDDLAALSTSNAIQPQWTHRLVDSAGPAFR